MGVVIVHYHKVGVFIILVPSELRKGFRNQYRMPLGPAATALWAPGGKVPPPCHPPAEVPGFRESGLQHLAQTDKPEK